MKCDHQVSKFKAILCMGAGLLLAVSLPVFASGTHHDKGAKFKCDNAVISTPVESLKADGVQVIHLGETYRLVISSSQLFNPDSANLTTYAHAILNNVARLLNAHHIISIKVAAYSDNVNPGIRKDALTARQATVVQEYLTDRGLKARLIYADGEGDKNPVASNNTWAGRYANRRVEISFMYIPKQTIYEVRVKANHE